MRHELRGIIAATGFASGDRVVVGHWAASPIGPMSDVMWAAPDGQRTLFVGERRIADFITAVYDFDRVEVVPTEVSGDGRGLSVASGDRTVHLVAGKGWRFPPRPPWVTRLVEAPVARLVMGVRTYGTSPSGVREWYRTDVWRPVRAGSASIGGRALGALAPVDPPCRFGFSEPPRRPSVVVVRPLLEDPTGRLDATLAALR